MDISFQSTTTPSTQPLMTVKRLCEIWPDICRRGGVRSQIFHADKNGLAKSGAIIRNGRRVLIDPERYLDWLRAGAR